MTPAHNVECYRAGPWRIFWRLGSEFAVQHLAMPDVDICWFNAATEPADAVDAGQAAYRWWNREGGEDAARQARRVMTATGAPHGARDQREV